MAAQVILIEAQPRRVADGLIETVRLAGGGGLLPYAYGGHSWRAGITGLPVFIASLDYEGGEFPSGSVPSAAEINWAPASAAALAEVRALMWHDAPITVRIGPEGPWLPPVRLSGRVLETRVDGGRLRIVLADPAASLKKPLLTRRWAGTGGLEGPVEWEGQIRRRVWGRVWNLSAEPLDAANNVYCLADPLFPIHAIDAVRDKGAAAASLTTLDWQGSAAATFAALQAAAAPQGGGVVCPSIACVKWWTQPAGDLCADLRGEIGTGYAETTADICAALVHEISGPQFAVGTLASARALRSAPVGWTAADDSATVAGMLDELLGNVSLLWLLDPAGQIVIREWRWGESVASAVSQDVSCVSTLRPVATRKLGFRRNETRMARGDLAGIVLAADVSFNDGVRLSDRQPRENGADVTSINQVTVEIAASRTIGADQLGAVSSDALAALVWSPRVFKGGVSIKLDNATSYALSGQFGGTFTVDNTNGSGSKGDVLITALTAGTAGCDLTITHDGVDQPKVPIRLSKLLASAPSPGGTGNSVSWTSVELVGINTTSYAPVVVGPKTLTLASGETLYATAPLDYTVGGTTATTRTMTFKWQYAAAGSGSWNDFAAGITGTTATSGYVDGEGMYNEPEPGFADVTQSKAGLPAGDYDVRLVAICSATGRTCTPSGGALVEAAV